jgi:tetratricopeptide (TPR) repeat protein
MPGAAIRFLAQGGGAVHATPHNTATGLVLLALLATTSTGCSSGAFGLWDTGWPMAKSGGSESGVYPGPSYAGNARSASRASSRGPGQPAPPKSFTQNVAESFQSTSSKIADALTLKPRVIPAADPIALSNKPEKIDPQVFVATGRMYESQGETARALEQYRKALKVAPNDMSALLCSARLYDRQGQYDEATRLYRVATTKHPNNALAFNDLGLCYARQGQVPSSLEALQQAVRLEPTSKRYGNNLATVLVEAGRINEAYDHMARVHGPAAAHFNLGFLLYERNDRSRAEEHFSKALELDPSLKQASQMLEQIGASERPTDTIGSRQSNLSVTTTHAVTNETPVRYVSRRSPSSTGSPSSTEARTSDLAPVADEYPPIRLPYAGS